MSQSRFATLAGVDATNKKLNDRLQILLVIHAINKNINAIKPYPKLMQNKIISSGGLNENYPVKAKDKNDIIRKIRLK